MLQQGTWCLGVKATRPDALPDIKKLWFLASEGKSVFGYQLNAYIPVYWDSDHPQVEDAELTGFYSITPPFPAKPICEIHPEWIVEIAVFELKPHEALSYLKNQGWDRLVQDEATESHTFADQETAAA